MARVIKRGEPVTAYPTPADLFPRLRTPAETQIEDFRREFDQLRLDLSARDSALEAAKLELGRAFKNGEARGRAIGRAEAEDRQTERVSLLGAGVADALSAYKEAMGSLERLSTALAIEGLTQVLGRAPNQLELLGTAIRKQISKLQSSAVLCIEVSGRDFREKDLPPLVEAIGRPNLDIRLVDDMPSGACHIKLTLGGLEVGLGQQLARFETLLRQLAQEDIVR